MHARPRFLRNISVKNKDYKLNPLESSRDVRWVLDRIHIFQKIKSPTEAIFFEIIFELLPVVSVSIISFPSRNMYTRN